MKNINPGKKKIEAGQSTDQSTELDTSSVNSIKRRKFLGLSLLAIVYF